MRTVDSLMSASSPSDKIIGMGPGYIVTPAGKRSRPHMAPRRRFDTYGANSSHEGGKALSKEQIDKLLEEVDNDHNDDVLSVTSSIDRAEAFGT